MGVQGGEGCIETALKRGVHPFRMPAAPKILYLTLYCFKSVEKRSVELINLE